MSYKLYKSVRPRSIEEVNRVVRDLRDLSHVVNVETGSCENSDIVIDIHNLAIRIVFYSFGSGYDRVRVVSESGPGFGANEVDSILATVGWRSVDRNRGGSLLLCGVGLAVFLWFLVPFTLWISIQSEENAGLWAVRGQVGDTFGSINALFSAIALAGVIVTIVLQRRELGLQRQELKSARVEFARTASAQELSVQMSVLKEAFDYIRETSDDRRKIYVNESHIKKVSTISDLVGLESSRPDVYASIRNSANCYQYIGFLIASGMLSKKREFFIEATLTMRRVYSIIWPIIEIERQRSGNPGYKKYFAWMYRESAVYVDDASNLDDAFARRDESGDFLS